MDHLYEVELYLYVTMSIRLSTRNTNQLHCHRSEPTPAGPSRPFTCRPHTFTHHPSPTRLVLTTFAATISAAPTSSATPANACAP